MDVFAKCCHTLWSQGIKNRKTESNGEQHGISEALHAVLPGYLMSVVFTLLSSVVTKFQEVLLGESKAGKIAHKRALLFLQAGQQRLSEQIYAMSSEEHLFYAHMIHTLSKSLIVHELSLEQLESSLETHTLTHLLLGMAGAPVEGPLDNDLFLTVVPVLSSVIHEGGLVLYSHPTLMEAFQRIDSVPTPLGVETSPNYKSLGEGLLCERDDEETEKPEDQDVPLEKVTSADSRNGLSQSQRHLNEGQHNPSMISFRSFSLEGGTKASVSNNSVQLIVPLTTTHVCGTDTVHSTEGNGPLESPGLRTSSTSRDSLNTAARSNEWETEQFLKQAFLVYTKKVKKLKLLRVEGRDGYKCTAHSELDLSHDLLVGITGVGSRMGFRSLDYHVNRQTTIERESVLCNTSPNHHTDSEYGAAPAVRKYVVKVLKEKSLGEIEGLLSLPPVVDEPTYCRGWQADHGGQAMMADMSTTEEDCVFAHSLALLEDPEERRQQVLTWRDHLSEVWEWLRDTELELMVRMNYLSERSSATPTQPPHPPSSSSWCWKRRLESVADVLHYVSTASQATLEELDSECQETICHAVASVYSAETAVNVIQVVHNNVSTTIFGVQDRHGNTPLHNAVTAGDVMIAKALVILCPSAVCTVNYEGNTPLDIAMGHRNDKMVDYLLRGCVSSDPHNTATVQLLESSLAKAMKNGYIHFLKIILELRSRYGIAIDIESTDSHGHTAWHYLSQAAPTVRATAVEMLRKSSLNQSLVSRLVKALDTETSPLSTESSRASTPDMVHRDLTLFSGDTSEPSFHSCGELIAGDSTPGEYVTLEPKSEHNKGNVNREAAQEAAQEVACEFKQSEVLDKGPGDSDKPLPVGVRDREQPTEKPSLTQDTDSVQEAVLVGEVTTCVIEESSPRKREARAMSEPDMKSTEMRLKAEGDVAVGVHLGTQLECVLSGVVLQPAPPQATPTDSTGNSHIQDLKAMLSGELPHVLTDFQKLLKKYDALAAELEKVKTETCASCDDFLINNESANSTTPDHQAEVNALPYYISTEKEKDKWRKSKPLRYAQPYTDSVASSSTESASPQKRLISKRRKRQRVAAKDRLSLCTPCTTTSDSDTGEYCSRQRCTPNGNVTTCSKYCSHSECDSSPSISSDEHSSTNNVVKEVLPFNSTAKKWPIHLSSSPHPVMSSVGESLPCDITFDKQPPFPSALPLESLPGWIPSTKKTTKQEFKKKPRHKSKCIVLAKCFIPASSHAHHKNKVSSEIVTGHAYQEMNSPQQHQQQNKMQTPPFHNIEELEDSMNMKEVSSTDEDAELVKEPPSPREKVAELPLEEASLSPKEVKDLSQTSKETKFVKEPSETVHKLLLANAEAASIREALLTVEETGSVKKLSSTEKGAKVGKEPLPTDQVTDNYKTTADVKSKADVEQLFIAVMILVVGFTLYFIWKQLQLDNIITNAVTQALRCTMLSEVTCAEDFDGRGHIQCDSTQKSPVQCRSNDLDEKHHFVANQHTYVLYCKAKTQTIPETPTEFDSTHHQTMVNLKTLDPGHTHHILSEAHTVPNLGVGSECRNLSACEVQAQQCDHQGYEKISEGEQGEESVRDSCSYSECETSGGSNSEHTSSAVEDSEPDHNTNECPSCPPPSQIHGTPAALMFLTLCALANQKRTDQGYEWQSKDDQEESTKVSASLSNSAEILEPLPPTIDHGATFGKEDPRHCPHSSVDGEKMTESIPTPEASGEVELLALSLTSSSESAQEPSSSTNTVHPPMQTETASSGDNSTGAYTVESKCTDEYEQQPLYSASSDTTATEDNRHMSCHTRLNTDYETSSSMEPALLEKSPMSGRRKRQRKVAESRLSIQRPASDSDSDTNKCHRRQQQRPRMSVGACFKCHSYSKHDPSPMPSDKSSAADSTADEETSTESVIAMSSEPSSEEQTLPSAKRRKKEGQAAHHQQQTSHTYHKWKTEGRIRTPDYTHQTEHGATQQAEKCGIPYKGLMKVQSPTCTGSYEESEDSLACLSSSGSISCIMSAVAEDCAVVHSTADSSEVEDSVAGLSTINELPTYPQPSLVSEELPQWTNHAYNRSRHKSRRVQQSPYSTGTFFHTQPLDSQSVPVDQRERLHTKAELPNVQDYTTVLHLFENKPLSSLSPELGMTYTFITALAYYKLSNHKKSVQYFKQCLRLAEKCHRKGDITLCNIYLGDIEFDKMHYTMAARRYQRALKNYSRNSVILHYQHMVLPTRSAVWLKCGLALENAFQTGAAVAAYSKAVKLASTEKDELTAHTSLGHLYQRIGEQERAIKEYNAVHDLAEKLNENESLALSFVFLNIARYGDPSNGDSSIPVATVDQSCIDLKTTHQSENERVAEEENSVDILYSIDSLEAEGEQQSSNADSCVTSCIAVAQVESREDHSCKGEIVTLSNTPPLNCFLEKSRHKRVICASLWHQDETFFMKLGGNVAPEEFDAWENLFKAFKQKLTNCYSGTLTKVELSIDTHFFSFAQDCIHHLLVWGLKYCYYFQVISFPPGVTETEAVHFVHLSECLGHHACIVAMQSFCNNGNEHNFPDLPSTTEEADYLEHLFKCKILVNEAATKNAVLDCLQHAKVVNISTHTYDGCLVFSDQHVLSPPEIENLEFQNGPPALVVLNCCCSAETRNGSNGLEGLALAFLKAGVPTVIAVLGDIKDKVALQFTKCFYCNMIERGMCGTQAMSAAEVEIFSSNPPHSYIYFGKGIYLSNNQ